MFAIRLTLCNTSHVGTSFHKLFILFVFHQEFLCFEDLKLSIDTYDSKQTKFFIQCIYHLLRLYSLTQRMEVQSELLLSVSAVFE